MKTSQLALCVALAIAVGGSPAGAVAVGGSPAGAVAAGGSLAGAIAVGAGPAWAAERPPPPPSADPAAAADLAISGINLGQLPKKRASVYLLTLLNQGPATAENVQVTGTLPSYVKSVRATPSECLKKGRRLQCSFASLTPGTDISIRLVVRAQAKAGGVKRFKVFARSDTLEGNIKDNTSVITSRVFGEKRSGRF